MKISTLIIICILSNITLYSISQNNDREYWAYMAYQIAKPILEPMSEGLLKEKMTIELSPTWDNRDQEVAYTEAFGRLMAGIAPWLELEDDNTPESVKRKQLKEWALLSYKNAVDPDSKDYLKWDAHDQTLVDAAYIANSFIRAPKTLWEPLDSKTKERYIEEFKKLRKITTPYNNWIIFRAMVEAFFVSIGEEYDGYALNMALKKSNEWYLSDGWYSDGSEFSLDYYNSYVINPMLVEILEVMDKNKAYAPISFDLAFRRMQRYNVLLERMISPEATYPAIGRSMTYRMGAFQPLALSAWKYDLPASLSNGQVRNALTSVMKRMFSIEGNFDDKGYLRLGFVGHQPDLADYYTNNGSLYITSLVFLPLGLPQDHPFWQDEPEMWTSQKAWSGQQFRKDYHESVK